MRITVLGKSPSWQDVDGACSGYLIEEHGTRVLLDCGNGVFAKMRRLVDYVDIDPVVISHPHAAPFQDLTDFARRTDLLLVEATLPRPEPTGIRGPLPPAEAGEHGSKAGAAQLVITHISDELDQQWAQQEAAKTFGREVSVAQEGAQY